MPLLAPVSIGDLLDRITILGVKRQHAEGAALGNVSAELVALEGAWVAAGLPADPPERVELSTVNTALWDVEDALRRHEARGSFDADFITLARRVYLLNDVRAALKRAVNLRLGSELVEEKVLPAYGAGD